MTRFHARSGIVNGLHARTALALILAAGSMWSTTASAAGTNAGTTISNTATASYTDVAGTPKTVDSNTVDIKVDELINAVVDATDPGDVVTMPGTTGQVLTYSITNTGNGNETFSLTANSTVGGDNYDPTGTQIYIDNPTSGTPGVYDPGVDILYTPGTNDPTLAPDASATIFVVTNTPSGVSDGDKGIVQLTVASTTGTGTPGTSFAGQGDGGTDAVIGTTGGDGQDSATFIVQNASLAFAKSASVLDPFGGSETVPGAIITYSLVATISGTGTLTGVTLSDNIPANTTYQTGTLTLQGGGLTDAADSDAGTYTGSAISVALGNVTGGNTRTVTFKVRVN
jgi:uncharacterized repeat protein (TIGR01451 family)